MKHLKKFKVLKSEYEFINYMLSLYPDSSDIGKRTAMLVAYKFIVGIKDPSFDGSYSEQFTKHMWSLYPNDDQYDNRTAMMKAFNFMNGSFDSEERQREKIRKMISDKTKKESN